MTARISSSPSTTDLQIRFDPREVHAVLHEHDEQRAEHDVLDPAEPAAQRDAGDDAGGDRFERHRGADIGLAGIEPGGQQHAGDDGKQRRPARR